MLIIKIIVLRSFNSLYFIFFINSYKYNTSLYCLFILEICLQRRVYQCRLGTFYATELFCPGRETD